MDLPAQLTEKLGPLPVWAWAGVGGIGLALMVYLRRKGGSSQPGGPIVLQPATGDTSGGGGTIPFDPGAGGGGGGLPPSTPPVVPPTNTPPPVGLPPDFTGIGDQLQSLFGGPVQPADYNAHLPSLASLYNLAAANPLPQGISPWGVPQVLPFPYVQTSGPQGDNRVVDRTSQLQPVYRQDGSLAYYSQPTVLNIPSATGAYQFGSGNSYQSGAPYSGAAYNGVQYAQPGVTYYHGNQQFSYNQPLAPGQVPPILPWLLH